MLWSRVPGAADAEIFMRWKVYTGSNFSEAFEGTNGLGTALAEQKPILVHRDEHFRAQWHMFSCAVAPLFDQAGRLAGAVNITSCREDLERTAHQLALAVTMEATRRMEGAIFRGHFRNAWIATVPGDGGSGLLAYDDDRRIVGACRSARALLGLTDGLIASGIDLSRYVKFDHPAARNADDTVELRRADGSPLGHGHVAPPLRARSSTRPLAPRRDAPADRFDALHRLAGRDPGLIKSVKRLRSIGDHNLPLLLHGETGVGKDVFARAIHAAGNRARHNYVALNCAAMPESLIDAELFGYEAGAFTGARRDGSKGLIVQGRRRHAVPRRDRRHADRAADAALARAGESRSLAARRAEARAGRHSPDQRHPSRPRAHGRAGRLPRRSLFPSARHGSAAAGLARARRPRRRHPPDRARGSAELPALGRGVVAARGLPLSRQHAPAPACPAARRLHGGGRRHHRRRPRSAAVWWTGGGAGPCRSRTRDHH
ncbi:hypothetical protein ACVW0I_007305 [Bradyrhizobium sp. LM6.11]